MSHLAAPSRSFFAAAPDSIHLWVVFTDAVRDPGLLERYRALLAPGERAREARFHFAEDRRRFVITRALVRTVLSRYAPVEPSAWVFRVNAHGRPEVATEVDTARALRFNLSHTGDLIVLGVTRGRALGVDTESLHRPASVDIADRFFSAQEVRTLRALPSERQARRFFEYWTLKEAYVKARGLGLAIPLDAFGFRFPAAGRVVLDRDPALGDPGSWSFWQYESSAGHLIAVCAAQTEDAVPEVQARRVVPLGADSEIELHLLAASAGA